MWTQIIQICASVAKMLNVAVLAQVTAVIIECISIIVIVLGVLVACGRIAFMAVNHKVIRRDFGDGQVRDSWIRMRRAFSESMLLGLQFLVAADIILTIGHPDIRTVTVLAAVVLIRVALSLALNWEIVAMKKEAHKETLKEQKRLDQSQEERPQDKKS